MVKKPRLFIALCTLPALILTIVFMIVPMVNAIYLSFTSSTALSVGFNSKFVFLDNYRYMFQDKDFLQALFNTLKLMLVIPAVTIFLSLVFAFILTQGQLKEKSFYRTVFFFPSIVSMTVVGIVWSFVFNPTRGILNHMLDLFHLSTWKHAWLGEGKTALWCIGAALVWQAIGYYMVMHVASIDGISQEVYEAASIDGATGVQKFFKITIPLLRRSIGTTYILSLSGTINLSFTLSNVMTGGGPNGASSVLLQYMYTQGMRNANFGYAMAIAMFTLGLAIVLAMISKKISSEKNRRETDENCKNLVYQNPDDSVYRYLLYPLFWNLMSAFKTNAEYLTDPYALPAALNLDNFVAAWQKANIAAYFGNSIFVTVLSTVLLLLLVIPISYVLARYRFVGSRLISTVYMACIFLQATYIMIPLFLELQAVNGLNNLPVLCLVYAVMQFPFCIFTLQGFMSAVPRDYEESARIDGATNIQLLLRVMVPLAKPGIATITMLSAMGFWNEYPLALVLLTEDAKKTLPIGMANLFEVQKYATDWGALFAGLVIVMIPTIIIYLIGQRYLLQGIGAGGLKG